MQQGSVIVQRGGTKKNKFKAFLDIIHQYNSSLSVGAVGYFETLMNDGERCSWSDHMCFLLTSDNRRVIPSVLVHRDGKDHSGQNR